MRNEWKESEALSEVPEGPRVQTMEPEASLPGSSVSPGCTVRVFPICVIFPGQNMLFVTQAELLVLVLPVQPQMLSRIKNLALGKSRHWFK